MLAERLASSGKRVFVVDKRPHIAGNAYDHLDAAGVLVHKYGPHIFHTNSEEIFAYLSRFTAWRPYEHRVLASVGDKLLPMPINRTTLNGMYGVDLADEAGGRGVPARRGRDRAGEIRTSRDVVISQVGTHLYRDLLRGLHAKAVGPRSVRTRQVGHRARADAHLDRRPLLPRHLSGHAGGWVHAHVREHARP